MRVNLNVTFSHIAKGKPGSPGSCPVALALLDATHGEYSVSVAENGIELSKDCSLAFFTKTPKIVSSFVCAFDDVLGYRTVKPFSIVLEFKEATIENILKSLEEESSHDDEACEAEYSDNIPWMEFAGGTKCDMCDRKFPLEEKVYSFPLPIGDGLFAPIAVTRSGWSYGDEKVQVALCPIHMDEELRKVFPHG